MQFTINIDDTLAGALAFARDTHNAAIRVPDGETLEAQPDYLADDAAYVQHVMARAAESYAKQALAAGVKLAIEKAISEGLTVTDVDDTLTAKVAEKESVK